MPTRRPRSANIVGVAVDGDVIRGAQVRGAFGHQRIVRCAEVEIPADVTDHGRIIDADRFTEALRDLWKSGGFRTKHLAFGIDGRDAAFRRLALPVDAAEHVVDAARYELSAFLPYDLEEAITSVHEVGRDETSIDVVAVAVRRATVEMITAAAAGAGLKIRDITLSSTALGLSIADGADGDSTIVSVDGASTTIVVRRAGRATVTRVLTGGGGERAAQDADELEEALASVDQFRQDSVTVASIDDPQVRRFRTVVEEVAAAIRFEESQQASDGSMPAVELAGAFGTDDSLVALMAAGVDADVTIARPPAWWSGDHPFAAYTTATGVALGAFDRTPGIVHLDAPSVVERRTRKREMAIGLAAAALVGITATQVVGGVRADALRATGAAESAELQADILAGQAEDLDDLAVLQEEVVAQRRIRQDALAGEIWWPRVLDEVAGTIPEDTFLTGLSLRRPIDDPGVDQSDATASFSGVALDQGGAAAWLLAVESLDTVDEVWLVQSTASVFGELELPVVAFIGEGQLTSAAQTPRSRGLDPGDGS